MLLLPEARDGDVWEPAKQRSALSDIAEHHNRNIFFFLHIAYSLHGLTDTCSIMSKLGRFLKHAKRALSLCMYHFICFRSTICQSVSPHSSREIKITKNISTDEDKNMSVAVPNRQTNKHTLVCDRVSFFPP